MKFSIMTLFPEMVKNGLNTSIIGRAVKAGLLEINAYNIRDFSEDKHKHVDDYPYGGGAGMVMAPEPIYACYKGILSKSVSKNPRVIYLTPQGKTFNQGMARELAMEDELVFLCGHYEGVDERIIEEIVTDNVSIGDYVLSGGELAVMVMIDAISRNVPGVLSNSESGTDESFEGNMLEYPQYTRPPVWNNREVPDVLLSGHHAKIEQWRREKSIERTFLNRPDLLDKAELNKKDKNYLENLKKSSCNE